MDSFCIVYCYIAFVTGSSLPQDVVLRAVKSVHTNLTEELADCCNATLAAVSAAVVIIDPTDDATGESGFPKWAISVVIFAGIIAVIVLMATVIALSLW